MRQKPERLLSLLPSSTEIVCALGLEDRLVGVTHECDYPPGVDAKPHVTSSRISHETMSAREIDHAVKTHLDGHGSIYDLDEQLMEELRPDLILTQELCDVCAVNYKMVCDSARIHAADATIVSLEPTMISEIFENIETVGEICGVTERSDALIASLTKRLDKIRAGTAGIAKRPRVFMLEWLEPPFAPGHWVPEQVEIAGGECILGTSGRKSVETTYETVVESNPEVLVLIPCGFYIEDTVRHLGQTVFPGSLLSIDAVRNENVWALDASSYFSRPGPRVVGGVEILAKLVHPELFGSPLKSEALNLTAEMMTFHSAGKI